MTRFRLSRFDLTVLIVSAAVLLTVAASALLLRPQEVPLRVVYMSDEANRIPDLWAVIPGQPDSATQLTFTEGGVFDYAPSPDGRRIAFAERDIASNRITLKLLDIASGRVSLLSDCAAANADCHTPAWRPDGSAIAYMRTQYDPVLGAGTSKIWMIEGLKTGQLEEFRMFDDQTIGSQPVWSRDGRRLAFYENVGRGVLIYDFNPSDESKRFMFVPADNGMTGALSPDGETLITSVMAAAGEFGFRSQLIVADLIDNGVRDLFPDGESNDGQSAAWHPDGQRAAILRQYGEGGSSTEGQQVYLYDVATEELEPLIVDNAYNHGALSFSPDGKYLLVQRFSYEALQPQIWVYEMETGALTQVAANAYIGAWLPGTT